ncbi:MAG: NAD(P)H-binding protein [Flavobacteriales bacterium]|jgi:uncharacterized protein YbjT (DUF2867 family)|nr:NAD(P)H-binding protein [Flavobacteriales bacterium]
MNMLVAGGSGLVGRAVLEAAIQSEQIKKIIALLRRPIDLSSSKLEAWLPAEGDLLTALRPQPVDAVICCLGTTIRNAGGDQSKFIAVDKDLVLGLARWAREQGVPAFAVVSAIGADAESRVFYNRVKGEMEEGLKAMSFPELHIFQPSILKGPRNEKRLGERIGIAVMSAIAPLLPDDYEPMAHDALAKALINCVGTPGGTHTYRAIRALAGS